MRTQTRPVAAPFRPEFGNLEHIGLAAPAPVLTPIERNLITRLEVPQSTPAPVISKLLQQPGPGPHASYLVGIEPPSGFAYSVWVDVAPAVYLAGLGSPIRTATADDACLEVTLEGGTRYVFA